LKKKSGQQISSDDMQTVSMASSRFRPERSAVVSEQFYRWFIPL